jgi:hypothetical protein
MHRASNIRVLLPPAAALLILASLLLFASRPAGAEELTRESYKAAVEPICQSNIKANERILAGVRKEVQQGKLKTAAAKFSKASKEQSKTLKQLEALPQPAADEARLAKWLGYLKIEAELFEQAGRKLKAGDKPGAEHIFAKLTPNANKANNQVLPFDFRYCRLEPQKLS